MSGGVTRIGVVAPCNPIEPETAETVRALAAAAYGGRIELVIHPQCFLKHGHFAGPDAARADAVIAFANDPELDAIWFARGGYGSGRIVEAVLAGLGEAARAKTYLGYSDAGFLLAALHKAGIGRIAHGPMLNDVRRAGGEAAAKRALGFLAGARDGLEPSLADGRPAAAFNLIVLSHLLGTPFEPDLTGHVLMIEEVSEEMYRFDRAFCHLTSSSLARRIAGLRLGRVSDVKPNDPDFGQSEEDIARFWCAKAAIAYLGRADIGHDAGNKIVPFGA